MFCKRHTGRQAPIKHDEVGLEFFFAVVVDRE